MQSRFEHNGWVRREGFTIVELMIATLVFSTILLVITFGVMSFTKMYYKSVYMSATQHTARDISDAVTNAVKFGTGTPTGIFNDSVSGNSYFCTGGYVFVYQPGIQYKPSSTIGMYMQPVQGNGCSIPVSSTARRQLLASNMRVSYLSFSGTNDVYTLTLRIAYGDSDLLIPSSAASDERWDANTQCISGNGAEYCAVSGLIATATRRV